MKRADLAEPGARIIALANPSKGVIYELTKVHPKGYDKQYGHVRSFIQYDFKVADDSEIRPPYNHGITSATLNYLNTYFALAEKQPEKQITGPSS